MSLGVHRFIPNSTAFLPYCRYSTYQPGDVIIDINDGSDSLFYILIGHVSISLPALHEDQEDVNLASLYSGDFFGELGLFAQQKERSAKVLAQEPTAIAKIDYQTFKKLTESDNEILLALSTQLADKLCATSRKLGEFILLERQTRKVCADYEQERQKLLLDPLTEIPNRQAYIWHVEQEFSRWKRYQRPVSMVVCDIDHFKSINDQYGHLAGDSVLQVVGKILKQRLRTCDFIARYGGEEFVIILPETSADDALKAADSTRALIEKCPLLFDGKPLSVTVSCGVTEFHPNDEAPEHTFERADKALYMAKKNGRNQSAQL